MVDEVEHVFGQGGTKPFRSPIYVWFWEHYAEIEPRMITDRVRWESVTARLSELGVTQAEGRALKPETVRRAWWQVRKDKQAELNKRKGRR